MKKVINIEKAPGIFVPTLVDVAEEVVEIVEVEIEVKEEKPKKKAGRPKKVK